MMQRLRNHSRYRHQQRGIALIYVLLIVAMIALMATHMVTNLTLHTDKNARYLERIQAKHYALGAEQYVALLLADDYQADKQKQRYVDHNNEPWHINQVDYNVDQGNIALTVIDEQSRFNVNWLATKGKAGEQYVTLFQQLLLTQALPGHLATSLQEWLGAAPDTDTNAADNNYLLLTPARRIANRNMVSTSELRLIPGIDAAAWEKLAPLIAALPNTSKLNLNTALADVIRSLSNKLTDIDAAAIIASRGESGFAELKELRAIATIQDKLTDIKAAPIAFSSPYFRVVIAATYRDTPFYLTTRLFRNAQGQVQVVSRALGP